MRDGCFDEAMFGGAANVSISLASSQNSPFEIVVSWLCFIGLIIGVVAMVRSVSRRKDKSAGSSTYVRTSPSGGFTFDPTGPEEVSNQAKDAYRQSAFLVSFRLYVKAIDRLHDLYVFEQFRNRQPSPADVWMLEGLASALGAARAKDSTVDVRDEVREATHRLRTIASAIERMGGSAVIYRRTLDELAGHAPDVDVSDIFWN